MLFHRVWYKLLDLGTRFEKQLEWLRSFQYAPNEMVYEFQLVALRNLFDHCYRNVPFYRKTWRTSGFNPSSFRELESIDDVPVTTRSDLRENFPSNTCAHNVTVLRRVRKFTSGSTGAPLEFFNDRGTLGVRLASRFLHNEWLGVRARDKWVRMTHHQAPYRTFPNETQVSTLAVNRNKACEIVQYLRKSNAKGLVAFPSVLRILAEALISKHERLNGALKAFVSTGETLLPSDRTKFSKAFGVDVYDRYSAQEVPGEWAQQCAPNSEMHWNPAIVFLEIRGGKEPARPGEAGRVLLTDLWNRTMPLVRYEVGDEMKAGSGCNCGRTWRTIAGPITRSQDSLTTRSGDQLSIADLSAIIDQQFGKELMQFQFVETGSSTYKIRITPIPDIKEFDHLKLKQQLSRYLADVEIETRDPIRLSSGKSPILVKV